jgi:hypothetical protein
MMEEAKVHVHLDRQSDTAAIEISQGAAHAKVDLDARHRSALIDELLNIRGDMKDEFPEYPPGLGENVPATTG